jgi:hypothetical protein
MDKEHDDDDAQQSQIDRLSQLSHHTLTSAAALMQKKRTRVLDYDNDTTLPNPALSKSMLLDKNNLEKLKS